MLDLQRIQTIRETIHSLLERCSIPYKVISYDHDLHQECVDEAVRRGYAVEGDHTVCTLLRVGVIYAKTAGGHLDRPTQIWTALYTSCAAYVDDIPFRCPSEIPHVYLFTNRFIEGSPQGNAALDALADLIRRAPVFFGSIPSKFIMTTSLNFCISTLLEYETTSMKVVSAAQRYPVYQRSMAGDSECYAYMAFPRDIPVTEYVQAIPEITLLVSDMNDILSFYKEDLAHETDTQIAMLAARDNESHLKTLRSLSDIVVGHYSKIMKILEGSPKAREAFKHFSAGYAHFHTSSERYKLAELNL